MTNLCIAATIIYYLGYMPEPGTTVSVPRSQVSAMSLTKQRRAKECARKFKINWTIDEGS